MGQPVTPSAARSWVSSPMRPTTGPTTAMSTSAAMIIRRTQRGAPGATLLDQEFVKLDQRASSWKRATGSSPLDFLAMSVGHRRLATAHELDAKPSAADGPETLPYRGSMSHTQMSCATLWGSKFSLRMRGPHPSFHTGNRVSLTFPVLRSR